MNTGEGKCHSHRIISKSTHDESGLSWVVNVGHLARLVFARLLHHKLTSPPCVGLSFESSQGMSRGSGRGLSFTYLRVEYLRTLPSFLCKEDLSVLHLFLQSFISIVWTHGYLCYALGDNPMLCSFHCSDCSSFVHWELFQIPLESFQCTPTFHICIFFFELFLPCWHEKTLPVYLGFLWPKISSSFKKTWFPLLENHTLYLILL